MGGYMTMSGPPQAYQQMYTQSVIAPQQAAATMHTQQLPVVSVVSRTQTHSMGIQAPQETDRGVKLASALADHVEKLQKHNSYFDMSAHALELEHMAARLKHTAKYQHKKPTFHACNHCGSHKTGNSGSSSSCCTSCR
jgi:hypothetical protein